MITLNKKYCLIFIIIIFFLFARNVDANVIINEVQILPTEGRFVELYNSSDASVDLTGWYLQRKTATGSEFSSLVSKTHFEGKSIEARGYFLISRSNMTNANIVFGSLTITESNTLQFKNSNGDVVNKVGWGDAIDCNTVCGQNPSEGKSISRLSNDSWIISSPTPGLLNVDGEVNNDNTNTNTPTSSTSTSSPTSDILPKKEPENSKITTKIITNKIAVAGVPFDINHQTIGLKKEKIILGKFVWNFGDGMSKTGNTSEFFQYVYQYPGDYVMTLSYYNNSFATKPEATDRINIKVIPSGINISSVGTASDPYIELENNSNYEIALVGWRVVGSVHHFIIPDGMTILPNKKLKLSPRITGFDINDLSSITVLNSSGEIFATYPSTTKIVQNPPVRTSYTMRADDLKQTPPAVIDLNDLGASANSIDTKIPTEVLAGAGLILVIIIGIFSTILLRKKNTLSDELEKNLKASDITIIE